MPSALLHGVASLLFTSSPCCSSVRGGLRYLTSFVQELPSEEEIGGAAWRALANAPGRPHRQSPPVRDLHPYDPTAGRRNEVPLERIPGALRNATIAVEDKTLYTQPLGHQHRGVGLPCGASSRVRRRRPQRITATGA
jgi:hypothetical protein